LPRCALTIFLMILWWTAAAHAEEISVSVDYQGHEIQLLGRFEKPPLSGPLPLVILLHNCAGIDGSPSLASWAQLLWAQGYATFRLDSFTARVYSNVCAMTGKVRPSERAQDVFGPASARKMCSPQPTYLRLGPMSDPTGWPCSGSRMAAVLQSI